VLGHKWLIEKKILQQGQLRVDWERILGYVSHNPKNTPFVLPTLVCLVNSINWLRTRHNICNKMN